MVHVCLTKIGDVRMNRKLCEYFRSLMTLISVLSLMLGMAGLLAAQTSTGTIVSVVPDPQGAVVSNAAVTAISTTTEERRATTTNPSVAYRVDAVDTAPY